MNTWQTEETDDIRGRALRFLITRELERAQTTMTVKEIIDRLEGYGFTILGRASKTVSDSLRWEIASGRVIRIRRGIYRYGYAPRTTLKRIRRLSQYCQDWIVALTRSPHQHNTHHWPRPWWSYAWLWQI